MRNLATLGIAAALVAGCAGTGTTGEGPDYGRSASFRARNHFTVTPPAGAKQVRAWFALPQNDPGQEVRGLTAYTEHEYEVVHDDQGNSFLFIDASGEQVRPIDLEVVFDITRREVRSRTDPTVTRPYTAADREEMKAFLGENTHIRFTPGIREAASSAVGDERNPILMARRLYDWTLENIDYWVKHPDRLKASPVGSSEYCLSSRTGNCTDFHSLWTALARSRGIPTRMVYGSLFKKENDGKDKDQSYHCWIEFWAPNVGWVAHDVAVADLFVGDFDLNEANNSRVQSTTAAGYGGEDRSMVDYYFGNLDERRVVWHRGRDLEIRPGQEAGPVNSLPKAYVEVDGKPLSSSNWSRKLTFEQTQ